MGLTYQWQKQDSNGTWVNIPGATASSYTINSVHPIHAGIYRVVIKNALGGIIHSANSNLHVTAPTGGKLWEFETEGHVAILSAIGSDGTVYVGSDDNKLYAINGQTGAKLWEFETGDNESNPPPAIGSDGTVYVGSNDNKLYAINGQTGAKLWEFETEGHKTSSRHRF